MGYRIKSKIWIEGDSGVLIGEGRIALLKEIGKQGSLSKASKNLGISYKKAWRLVDSTNKSAKKNVTITAVGGRNGGGAQLTKYGEKLIVTFDEINKNCWEYLDQQLDKLDKL